MLTVSLRPCAEAGVRRSFGSFLRWELTGIYEAISPAHVMQQGLPMAHAGRLQQAAQRTQSRQEVVSALDDMFPPTTSAAKSQLLREAFAAVCPAQPYKVSFWMGCGLCWCTRRLLRWYSSLLQLLDMLSRFRIDELLSIRPFCPFGAHRHDMMGNPCRSPCEHCPSEVWQDVLLSLCP